MNPFRRLFAALDRRAERRIQAAVRAALYDSVEFWTVVDEWPSIGRPDPERKAS